MTKEIMNIVFSAIGVIITGLASFMVAKFTQWVNQKIQDKKAAEYLATINELAWTCVREVYQTYVETLKKEGKFDKEAQEKALNNCLSTLKAQLKNEIWEYIKNNFGDIDTYLTSLIESIIFSLKR